MANILYLISSLFFLGGSILALRTNLSPINIMYILGSTFFAAAAAAALFHKKR